MTAAASVERPWNLAVGDRAPSWRLHDCSGNHHELGDFVGQPLVLLFCSVADQPFMAEQVLALGSIHAELRTLGANVVVVSGDENGSLLQFARDHEVPFTLLTDAGQHVARAYSAFTSSDTNGTSRCARKMFLIDPNLRVLQIIEPGDAKVDAAHVLGTVRGYVTRERPRRIQMQAPVLLIPDVLDADLCRRLIDVWENDGNEDSGFMKQIAGSTVGVLDYGHKIRRDHFLKDGPLKALLNRIVFHRVRPEIWKAFHFQISRFEDFRIACYDAARGGYFRPHRDNTTDGTAHRCFAMTLNLNVGEYEGGFLRFPEYGCHLYRPETGSAVIFSCSLLHEATDVTAGRRFTLLSFFYGEEEAKKREAYSRRVGGDYRHAHNSTT